MTLRTAVLDAIQTGLHSRPQIESYVIAIGYAPAGVPRALIDLKRLHLINHIQRGGRGRQSRYEARHAG